MNVRVRSINRISGLLVGPIMLVIGLGILFLGWQWRTFTQNQIATMLTTEGRVVEVVSRTTTSGGERKTYFLHLQETFSDVVKTDKTGLSKTAHTRWMISAFANFLPGSTIFRLA